VHQQDKDAENKDEPELSPEESETQARCSIAHHQKRKKKESAEIVR
jgi:hypothetical protein